MTITLVSWNVNGLAARIGKGDLSPLLRHNPEIVCLQQTKIAPPEAVRELNSLYGYRSWFSPLWKGRYNGVGMLARIPPDTVSFETGDPRLDGQGRVMTARFQNFSLVNVSVPSVERIPDTMNAKLGFLDGLLDLAARILTTGQPAVLCGDFNVAHTDRDLWSAESHEISRCGVSVEERSRLDRLTSMGFNDAQLLSGDSVDAFTWWPTGHGFRQKGRGWRLDYFFVSRDLADHVQGCSIMKGIRGSDHCPVSLELDFSGDL